MILRVILAVGGSGALVLYAWMAIAVRGGANGTDAAALEEAASEAALRGLARLNDIEAAPGDRLQGYRDELGRAEGLLVDALRVQPTRASSLARRHQQQQTWRVLPRQIDPPEDRRAQPGWASN